MNRVLKTTSHTFKGAMRYWNHLLEDDGMQWVDYMQSSDYEDDIYEFRLLYQQVNRSKVCMKDQIEL